MSLFNRSYFVLFLAFSTGYIFSAPTSPNPYDSFIEYLVKSNCSMPHFIKLPFPEHSDDAPFGYLSDPLKECRTPDALRDSDEAKKLCSEIFDVLQNITCVEYVTPLSEIQSAPLSEDACKDFKVKGISLPRKEDYLSWRLVDPILCEILCSPGKYHLLCETLLWSHDLQLKIKSAQKMTEGDTDLFKEGSSGIKISLVSNQTDSPKQKNNDYKEDPSISNSIKPTEDTNSTLKVLSKSNSKTGYPNEKTSSLQIVDEHESSTIQIKKENSLKVINTTKIPSKKNEVKNNEDLQVNENLQISPKTQEQNELKKTANKDKDNPVDLHAETVSVEANSVIPDNEDVKNQQPLAGNEQAESNPSLSDTLSTPKVSPVSVSKNEKNNLEKTVDDKQNTKSNVTKSNSADVNAQSEEKLNSIVSKNPEIDNELSNVDLDGQENESKAQESNGKSTGEWKKTEKPKLTDFDSPIGLGSEAEAKPTESTTLELLPDKDEEHQEEKDPDQYNDTENEGDYAKSDYGNFDPPLKNKEVDMKSSGLEGPNQIPNNYDGIIRSRNNMGRLPDEGPMISSFPEQEDSHFFFYFLSIVLILMAGYLIFHNKQKIIALIVEGRHERRRRSHGSGYKKLETK